MKTKEEFSFMKLKILGLVFLFVILSSIYPVYFYYYDKSDSTRKNYTTIDSTMYHILPSLVKKKGEEKKCTGFILPVEKVEAPDNSFPNLAEDINIVLSTYRGWTLSAKTGEMEQMKKRFEKRMAEWGAFYDGDDFIRMMERMKKIADKTNYSTSAKWYYVQNSDLNNVRLVLTVFHEEKKSREFEIALNFIHPGALDKINAADENKRIELKKMRSYNDLSVNFLLGFSGLFLGLLFTFAGYSVYAGLREKRRMKYFLAEIGKREQLVDNGDFVTAYQLAENYLKYFPDDTDIKAFRERLLDITNNDPKKAQVAFVEAKKLRRRLSENNSGAANLLLDEGEKEEITALAPYNEDLAKVYEQYRFLEHNNIMRKKLIENLPEIRKLIEAGKLDKAGDMLSELKYEFPGDEELSAVTGRFDARMAERKNLYDEIKASFSGGDIIKGKYLMKEFQSNFPEYIPADELDKSVNTAPAEKFSLVIMPEDYRMEVIRKTEVLIGREDEGNFPDISFDDRRISREQLRIKILENSITCHDKGSAGGTFINGEKITEAELKNGDILNLAKIKEYSVTVSEFDGSIGGLFLSSRERNILVLKSHFDFSLRNGSGNNMLQDFRLYHSENILILTSAEEFFILNGKREFTINDKTFKLEEI